MTNVPPGRPRSYRALMLKPGWWLLDNEKKVVASIRADTAEEARHIFKANGLTGAYLRRVDP